MKIRLSSFVKDSIVDGEGIRSVIFTQGCPHNCPGCHNQKAIPFEGGELIDTDEVIKQTIAAGHQKVTFSGGEPFAQPKELYIIAKALREAGFNIWSYSGYTYNALIRHHDPYVQKLLSQLDILVDGRFLLEKRSIAALFRGSTNQRIIDVQQSLKTGTVVLAEKFQDEREFIEREPDIFI
ncbi:anaerobic ribonucleoside-triphosphate reductase activating protein [Erysipelothrix urinaevulpis]|uniref:anaerobic ribonucleoside-triphosphate reductase activating protein n=1 Tax=Erysipelothrix urinaevulpis TaxID=2683717 RepID=UPI001358CF27|nr:anaerobic ribonucleoside-triphosphate reductase activating protein [Erysipelothrix urinaevulpis]